MSLIFEYPITVTTKDIDSLNHVNNEVYIKWLMQAANAHSAFLGYALEKFLSSGACFVVRRHVVDYLAPAFLDEDLIIETWVTELHGSRCTRVYLIKRQSDNKTLIKAKTLWVYINLKTGRPIEIPKDISIAFAAYLHDAHS